MLLTTYSSTVKGGRGEEGVIEEGEVVTIYQTGYKSNSICQED